MDGLGMVTGIALVVFLLFYLAFKVEKEHTFLKILCVFAGLFMLIYIAQSTIYMDRDCSINNAGNYSCYYTNGTAINSYENSEVGKNFFDSYLWFLRIFGIYILVFYSWKMLNYFGFVGNRPKVRRLSKK